MSPKLPTSVASPAQSPPPETRISTADAMNANNTTPTKPRRILSNTVTTPTKPKQNSRDQQPSTPDKTKSKSAALKLVKESIAVGKTLESLISSPIIITPPVTPKKSKDGKNSQVNPSDEDKSNIKPTTSNNELKKKQQTKSSKANAKGKAIKLPNEKPSTSAASSSSLSTITTTATTTQPQPQPQPATANRRRSSARLTRPPPMTLDRIHQMLRDCKEPNVNRVPMRHMGGFGVVAKVPIYKNDFVCEYSGDLISIEESKERENQYIEEDRRNGNDTPMCYMYYLNHKGKRWCVDATKSGRIGRLINHSRLKPSLRTKMFTVDGVPRLGLIALRDIVVGEEVLYDYGERDPATLKAHPWLRS